MVNLIITSNFFTEVRDRAEFVDYFLVNILLNKNRLLASDGPIKKANNKVPKPTTPPNVHPTTTAVNSIPLLTHAIGKLVSCCNPVIRPSLGPGPKLDIR